MDRSPKVGGLPRRGNGEQPAASSSTDIKWPAISPADQDSLIELLCNIIAPVGLHRTNHSIPSKGKKDKKRKRSLAAETSAMPAPPTISSCVVVGPNNIVRRLNSLSDRSKPRSGAVNDDADILVAKETELDSGHFAAIFVVLPSTPPVIRSMLPWLVYTASLAHPELPRTRLIQLPGGCESRICQALSLPRVSCIGILESSSQGKSFIEFVRTCVPEVRVPWLKSTLYS